VEVELEGELWCVKPVIPNDKALGEIHSGDNKYGEGQGVIRKPMGPAEHQSSEI
jgi:hypothetical protein